MFLFLHYHKERPKVAPYGCININTKPRIGIDMDLLEKAERNAEATAEDDIIRRLDAPVLSPIARIDENNGYGDDAALELALQASLEDAARATPRRKPAPPPGPQLHPFG